MGERSKAPLKKRATSYPCRTLLTEQLALLISKEQVSPLRLLSRLLCECKIKVPTNLELQSKIDDKKREKPNKKKVRT